MTGTCRLCGQIVSLKKPADSEEEADFEASMLCSCTDAKIMQMRYKRIERAKKRIDELFGPPAVAQNFEPITEPEVIEQLHRIVELTGNGKLERTSITLPRYGKAKISLTSKSLIKIERSEVHACQMEE
jgi:hypothetical protein